jgi:hypothetical protein
MASKKHFDRSKSILKDLYVQFSCNDPGELDVAYLKEDQRLMYATEWDYYNSSLVPNIIKNGIEKVGLNNIPDEKERRWIQEILWLWYHHAFSCAIYRYKDKKSALKYSRLALKFQPENHPNKITRLMYLLIRDKLREAKEWQKTITLEPEKSTAVSCIEDYKKGFFNTSE